MGMRVWSWAFVAALSAAGPAWAADEAAGYVLALQGRWSLQGGPALAVGAAVPAGARLQAQAPALGDRIVVVEARSGAVLAARRCDSAAACALPLAVPARPAGRDTSPQLAQLVEQVITRIAGDPDRYVATLSRGLAQLDEAVLPVDPAGSVDFSPLLRGQPAGRYELRLAALPCRDCATLPAPALPPLEWKGQGPAALPGLARGLYELQLVRPPGGRGPERARGWVLLLPVAESDAAAETLRAGQALVAGWGPGVDATPRRAFTRALLDALATVR